MGIHLVEVLEQIGPRQIAALREDDLSLSAKPSDQTAHLFQQAPALALDALFQFLCLTFQAFLFIRFDEHGRMGDHLLTDLLGRGAVMLEESIQLAAAKRLFP